MEILEYENDAGNGDGYSNENDVEFTVSASLIDELLEFLNDCKNKGYNSATFRRIWTDNVGFTVSAVARRDNSPCLKSKILFTRKDFSIEEFEAWKSSVDKYLHIFQTIVQDNVVEPV